MRPVSSSRLIEAANLGASPIQGYPGYFVDRTGQVFSGRNLANEKPLRKLKAGRHSEGYPQFGLCRSSGRVVTLTAHKLVALVYLPPRPSKKHGIRHLDGDPTNNRVENLAWGTQLENIQDKTRHGTLATGARNGRRLHPENYPVGEDTPMAKLTTDDVLAIRGALAAGELGYKLAEKYGVRTTTISAIRTGKNWKHLWR